MKISPRTIDKLEGLALAIAILPALAKALWPFILLWTGIFLNWIWSGSGAELACIWIRIYLSRAFYPLTLPLRCIGWYGAEWYGPFIGTMERKA